MLLALPLGAIYVGVLSLEQEAAEQRAARGEEAPPADQPEDFPINLGSGANVGAEGRPRVIPGLSDMDVIGELQQYIPGTNFRCPGGAPAGGGNLSKRSCRSSRADDSSAVYEVTLVEDDPPSVVSVTAIASDASDEEAARVLGRVARLAVGDSGPLDSEAWVDRTIFSGGQYSAEGTEVRLYGAQGNRTLEIVGASEPRPTRDSRPKADQGKLDDAFWTRL